MQQQAKVSTSSRPLNMEKTAQSTRFRWVYVTLPILLVVLFMTISEITKEISPNYLLSALLGPEPIQTTSDHSEGRARSLARRPARYLPGKGLTLGMRNAFIRLMNDFRSHPNVPAANMNEVTYNLPLEQALLRLLADHAAKTSWAEAYGLFYNRNTSCRPPLEFDSNLSLYCLLDDHPEFKEFVNQGCHAMVLDSCKVGRWINVIRFRVKQKACFNYNGCNDHRFTGYRTCNYTANTNTHGEVCPNFWMYIPQFYRWDYTSFAMIPTWKVPPPWITDHHNSGYVLFGCATQGNGNPPNDRPYQAGAPGSNCAPGRVRSGNLCKPSKP